jgi:hypothetical protein
MDVHLGRLGSEAHDAPVDEFEQLAHADRFGEHRLTHDPKSAEVILFPQCHMLPADWRLSAIRDHPLAVRYWDKVMVYDERDRPWCGFPGVYVSMPASGFDSRYQRAWGYVRACNPAPNGEQPDLLFSFIGSPTHACRESLFGLHHPDAIVERVSGFMFHDPTSPGFAERRARFRTVLSRSRFVLCPRGHGTSSIRLFETLAAGRVPVIISDDWVPPVGPDWRTFSIRWPEGRADRLVEALKEFDTDWPDMCSAASAACRDFFGPEVDFHRVVQLCRELRSSSTGGSFPRSGIRNRAWLRAHADAARHRINSAARRTAKPIPRRFRA